MRKADHEETMPSPKIWKQVWEILEEISDESGEDDLDKDYLLKYEGWGGVCVEEVWVKVEEEQERMGIVIENEEGEEEREKACYEFAEEQSYKIIDEEWKPKLKVSGYRFLNGGYDYGGLYGRTWALFKKGV